MTEIDHRIIKFINKHHVLTLATSVENQPYCSNCFYVYDLETNAFVFTSSDDTKHVADVLQNARVAASVVLETTMVGKIRGLQITGSMLRPEDALHKRVKKLYLNMGEKIVFTLMVLVLEICIKL